MLRFNYLRNANISSVTQQAAQPKNKSPHQQPCQGNKGLSPEDICKQKLLSVRASAPLHPTRAAQLPRAPGEGASRARRMGQSSQGTSPCSDAGLAALSPGSESHSTAPRCNQTPGRGQQHYSLSLKPTEQTAESAHSWGKLLIHMPTFQITAIYCWGAGGRGGGEARLGLSFRACDAYT